MKKTTAIIILDGFGYREEKEDNAILLDGIRNIRPLWENYPHTLIEASGLCVGLPEGQMGNSEVGHMNIGAGRVVLQDYPRIERAIETGEFYEIPAFVAAVENCKKHGSALHLLGLCSDGGIHSRLGHLYALLELAKRNGLEKVYIHAFMDGRDTPPTSGADYIAQVVDKCAEIGVGEVASVQGRYYGMDRDKRYERVEPGYDAIVNGVGVPEPDPVSAVRHSYEKGVTDEFIVPAVIMKGGAPVATVNENDSVIFFNFRTDRPTEMTEAFIFPEYNGFERKRGYIKTYYVCMTVYREDFLQYADVAIRPIRPANMLGEYVGSLGLTQLRIAESEKQRHVTFFFNGGTYDISPGEDHYLIPSPKVATYDLQPEMRAYDLADKAVEVIREHKYDLIVMNFANPDMVGHTAVREACIAAVHAVDECVGRIARTLLEEGGQCLITADHGNCELMVENGKPMTAHTTNPVPVIYVAEDASSVTLRSGGKLANLAPTLLDMMGLKKPAEMTESSLIVRGDCGEEPIGE
ncbi:MAG: 2,3-bisphosphoglycerate-independent phosphoglycerate mutase [Clostridia bacterium]|nr:2,3-bisphosphoglycerate-independent phosphoglycerate mutase [Clostridia bacterium]